MKEVKTEDVRITAGKTFKKDVQSCSLSEEDDQDRIRWRSLIKRIYVSIGEQLPSKPSDRIPFDVVSSAAGRKRTNNSP